jgi:hypothetical protein
MDKIDKNNPNGFKQQPFIALLARGRRIETYPKQWLKHSSNHSFGSSVGRARRRNQHTNKFAFLAQSVERVTFNHVVVGSTPTESTYDFRKFLINFR